LVFQLRAKVQDVEIVSESLRVDIDLQNLNVAASQNQTQQLTTKGKEDGDDLLVNTRPGKDNGNVKWINGPEIEVYNFTSAPVTVSFETAGKTKDAYGKPASFTLEAKARKLVTVPTNKDGVLGLNVGKDTLYAGSFLIKTTTSTITLTAGLQLQRGAKFKP